MGPCLRPLRPEPGGAEPSCGCPFARRTQKVASLQVKALDQMADVQGGWGYYTFETFSKRPIGEPTSFLTATVLLAYKDAEQAFGLKAEPRIVKRAVACLEKTEDARRQLRLFPFPFLFIPAGPSTATPAAWPALPPGIWL